jgi:hypothetical protein
METTQVHRAEKAMARLCRHPSSSPISTSAWLVACLMILLGVAFELGMLGFGPYNSSGVWLFSVLGRNGWIMLADFVAPQLRELVKMWPLTLVTLGSAILLAARQRSCFDLGAATSSKSKENNAN